LIEIWENENETIYILGWNMEKLDPIPGVFEDAPLQGKNSIWRFFILISIFFKIIIIIILTYYMPRRAQDEDISRVISFSISF